MSANGSRATYSCSEVGLEFNYFDSRSPWAAIHAIASAQAPGTVGYLLVNERVSNVDIGVMSDYDVATCDEAVTSIKEDVAAASADEAESVDDPERRRGHRVARPVQGVHRPGPRRGLPTR